MDKSKQQNKEMMSVNSDNSIYRIPPYFYIHVLDQTTNVTRVETGPQTFIRRENERVVVGPQQMIVVPPRCYCVVENPVLRDAEGNVQVDKFGQVRLGHGDEEVRMEQDPFPLYPGESLMRKVARLEVVRPTQALRLIARRDFEDGDVKRVAGDEWLFEGPGTYIPRKEVEVMSVVESVLIHQNEALKLEASRDTVDREGKKRVAGEQWLVKTVGAYLPGAHETVIGIVKAHVLTEKTAIHIQATSSFVDQKKIARKNGEEWLVKFTDMETYIPDVFEKVVGEVNITTLNNRQYCVICNPVDDKGKPQLGRKKLIKGEASFFLQPGESLESGIRGVYVMGDKEGLILCSQQAFADTSVDPPVQRKPGDRWMITGPAEYVPPVEVEVVSKQKAIPLHENEGIYVRNIKTGQVRSVIGSTYMLTQEEELWHKILPPAVLELFMMKHDPVADRGTHAARARSAEKTNEKGGKNASGNEEPVWDSTRVVTFQVPHNAAVQLYDYKSKKSRVMFGPDLVMLGPDEEFTQLSLSGGKPKRPNVIRTMTLLLGPDFCTDVIVVETSDHARLSLQLAYNWHFNVGDKSQTVAAKLFSVPDFVGDACKAMASRIRGAVAGVRFDDFHKSSAEIIRTSVFGLDEKKMTRDQLVFPQNNLQVTSVDIQSVEPVDQRTRDALQKSVQLAIEITINSQEATAKHEAQRLEQEARGRLETQKIQDSSSAEKARKELLELQAASSAVESCGQAKAEAQSRAEAAKIEGEAAVLQARLKADANKIEAQSELERLSLARQSEIQYLREQIELEVKKTTEMAKVEVDKFKQVMDALGTDTLKAMATAGLDQQVRLLQALGMKSTLITDGHTPINLLSAARGLLGATLESDS